MRRGFALLLAAFTVHCKRSEPLSLSLPLSLGELSFSLTEVDVVGGPHAVLLDTSTRLGAASPVLASTLAACGGSLEAFLPPRAILVHLPQNVASQCVSAINAEVPGVLASAVLPAALRSPLLNARAPETADAYPVRVLSVTLAASPSCAAELEADLAPLLIDGGIVIVPTGNPRLILVSALAFCPDTTCSLAAPADACACVVSTDIIKAVASHTAVLWVESVKPTFSSNAFARSSTQTTDVVNSQDIAIEYGACGDAATECAFLDAVPFSRLKDLYSNLGEASSPLPVNASLASANLIRPWVHHRRSQSLSQSTLRVASPAASNNSVQHNMVGSSFQGDLARGAFTEISSETPSLRTFHEQRLASQTELEASTCTATCSAPSCGLGYGSCGGLVTPLPLDGTGQTVNVVDSGVDWRHPFYYDSTYSVASVKTPPLSLSPHRKIPAYWGYMDAFDDVGGHGTHVCGSVAGNAAPIANANDAPVLEILSGMAPLAKLVFTDVGCSTVGGCSPPPSIPSASCTSTCAASSRAVYTPADMAALFQPAHDAGVRISTNSWGGGDEAYGTNTKALDDYVVAHPDHLLIFAAGNDGSKYSTLGSQAVAKNVLSVGAVQDGILSHVVNVAGMTDVNAGIIPPLAGLNTASGCGTLLRNEYASGGSCPPLSPANCASLVDLSQTLPTDHFADLALCCGCSPKQILDGFYTSVSSTYFQAIVALWALQYNSRVTADFSSRGPTLDGRIKPDIASPGVDIISARSSAGASYNLFACSSTPSDVTNYVDQALVAFSGAGSTTFIASVPMTTTEAATFTTVKFPFTATTTGTIFLMLLNADLTFVIPPMPLVVSTSGSYTASFVPNIDLGPGFNGLWAISASSGFQLSLYTTLTVTAGTQCFGTLPSARSGYYGFQLTVTRARGGPLAWVIPDSGTSMATPVTAGNVALVRQFFTDGFYPSGRATSGAGFSPSAALLKAIIVNSASPVIDAALAALLPILPTPSMQQILTESGHGVVNLARGLSFATLGSVSRSTGALVTLVLPGLQSAGSDPTIADAAATVYCIDTTAPSYVGGSLPLSITLVWTDPGASPVALYALVNDIDLEVYLPSSDSPIYGNNDPTANPQQPDTRNNVEKVLISSPASTLSSGGTRLMSPFRIIVRGSNIPSGPQAFSLVVTGAGAAISSASCGGDPLVSPSPTPTALPSSTPTTPASAAIVESSAVTPTVAALISTTVIFALIAAVVAAILLCPRATGGSRYGPTEKAQLLLPTQAEGPAPPQYDFNRYASPHMQQTQMQQQQMQMQQMQMQQQQMQPPPSFLQPQPPLQFRKREAPMPAPTPSYGTVLPGEAVNVPLFANPRG